MRIVLSIFIHLVQLLTETERILQASMRERAKRNMQTSGYIEPVKNPYKEYC